MVMNMPIIYGYERLGSRTSRSFYIIYHTNEVTIDAKLQTNHSAGMIADDLRAKLLHIKVDMLFIRITSNLGINI